MHHSRLSSVSVRLLAGAAICLTFPSGVAAKPTVVRGSPTPTITTYATGFNNPRGLKFGPDGVLYVAEGGPGGNESTVGTCDQAAGPPAGPGPYTGSETGGRISKVVNGLRVTVNDQFPTSQTSEAFGFLVSGVADVAWINGTMYALVGGGGCSHGVAHGPNGIYRVNGSAAPQLVADLGAYQMSHPVAHPELDDFEPDGTWYSMVASNGALYAVEPNHGELDKITTGGAISRVVDISASQGHIVPTSIAQHGVFYVGNLGTFPITDGSEKIIQITPSGQIHTVATGLTTVLGVAFDNRARMYVLENTVGSVSGLPEPGLGKIVRITGNKKETLVTGLALPTAMTFGPDGALYVSNLGFGPPPSLPDGPGMVLRIRIDD
ncbi:MAG TPA: ScyD/ScyE family protein [Sphingomicrobium sp.]|jgi:hypothetical protein